jgi:hypothetical protein
MAFINEYISEENIEKFQINELMNGIRSKYSKREVKFFPDKYYKHHWAIDKERESWFMWGHNLHDPLEPSRYTGERSFILNYQGENIEVILRKVYNESSEKITDNPFNIVWTLERITPESIEELSYEKIIVLVKEALDVYGTDGIETRVPFENIVVTCKF